jgi:hypothetical protein
MARLIFKCPYLKSGGTAARRGNYVRYIATRDGVEFVNDNKAQLSATAKQCEFVENLLKDFPEMADSFEYEDYAANPTRANASEFITAALEQNAATIGKRANYVEYIARRPRAEKFGTHGLFTSAGTPIVLSRIAEEAANHAGNLWLPIISLRREDAERLVYDNAEQWCDFLSSYASDLAAAIKIPAEHFKWFAAFHDEGNHPHVHMVVWSTEPGEGFLTKDGIRKIKSGLAARLFRDDLLHVYERQTQYRSKLGAEAKSRMLELIAQMQNDELTNERIEQLIIQLAVKLRKHKGKKQYGYLSAPLKNIVDEITDELCADSRVAECYKLWCEARLDVLRTYLKNPPHPGPLSRQPELKRIRNIVIEEAAMFDVVIESEQATINTQLIVRPNPKVVPIATRLLHHIGNIFQENPPLPRVGSPTERKLLQKLRQKKIAQGHADDDHAERQTL